MRWFNLPVSQDAHQQVFQQVDNIRLNQTALDIADERNYRLYCGTPLYTMFTNAAVRDINPDRLVLNVAQSCIDTMVSKVTKNEPRVTFLTDEGDFIAQENAKKLDRYTYGQFYECDVYKTTKKSLLDCLIWGDGEVKVSSHRGKIQVTRLVTPFIVVDEREAIHGEPFTKYQLEFVDKTVLKEKFPKFTKEIDEANAQALRYFSDYMFDSNLVLVIEAWKLASSDGANDGRHFLGINNATFEYTYYTRDYFPTARISYQPNPLGYRSKGICDLLTGYQVELNRTCKKLQDAYRLASPKWLVETMSKVVKTHFNNQVGTIMNYTGTPPVYFQGEAISSQYFEYVLFLYGKAYEEIGLSQLSATSMKPSGLNSAVAMREYSDLETERFASFVKSWQNFHLDIADLIYKESVYQAKNGDPIEVKAPIGDSLHLINFKDIDLKVSNFVMQTYPVSMLPKTPAGRLEFITEAINAGMLAPEEGWDLLDFPDIKAATRFKNAPINDIKNVVTQIVENGVYNPPEQYQNLAYGIQYVQFAYLYYKNKKLDVNKLDMLTRWIEDALFIQQQAMPQQQLPMDQMSTEDLIGEDMQEELPQDLESSIPTINQ